MKIERRQFLKTLGAATVVGNNWEGLPKKSGEKRMSEFRSYSVDVAVIGAGVFGSWIASSLKKSGAKVSLLDEYGPANARASSGGESRIIRMGYGADEIYTRWSLRALSLWKEFFAESRRPELFHTTGVLWIAPQNYQYALDSLATLQKNNILCENLSLDDLRRRYPQI